NYLPRHTPCSRSEPRLNRWIPWCSSDADDDEGRPDAGELPAEAVYGVGVGEVVYELRVERQLRRALGRRRAAAPGRGSRVGLAAELDVARGDFGTRHRADVVLRRVQRRGHRHFLGEPLVEQAHGHAGWS